MSTYTQLLYHLVFSTKYRKPVMDKVNRVKLYKYIWGILQNKKCHLYQINGVEDHLHIITHIPPSIAISSLIKDIKVSSSSYIKEEQIFHNFPGWQVGYGAFSYAISSKDQLIEYVKNQEKHHEKMNFREEYIALQKNIGLNTMSGIYCEWSTFIEPLQGSFAYLLNPRFA